MRKAYIRKTISLAVAVLLLICSTCSAYAAPSAASKEILFRGIPWGSSPQEVKSSFDASIRWKPETYNACFGMDYWTTGDGPLYGGDICAEIQSELSMSNRIEVAGMKASMVTLRFVRDPATGDLSFLMAEYIFASGDPMDIFFDLMEKLSDLYGPFQDENMKFTPELDMYNIWKDGEGNTISLFKHGSQIVSLRYLSAQMDSLLSAAENGIKTSYDGL